MLSPVSKFKLFAGITLASVGWSYCEARDRAELWSLSVDGAAVRTIPGEKGKLPDQASGDIRKIGIRKSPENFPWVDTRHRPPR